MLGTMNVFIRQQVDIKAAIQLQNYLNAAKQIGLYS